MAPRAKVSESAKLERKLSTSNTFSTQRSDRPCGGKASVSPAESEAATITANGPIRNSRTSARASVEAGRDRIRRPCPGDAAHDEIGGEAHHDQYEGDDGGRDEVVGDGDALVEQGLQHQHLAAAEHGGRDIGGHRPREDERAADREVLRVSGSVIFQKI